MMTMFLMMMMFYFLMTFLVMPPLFMVLGLIAVLMSTTFSLFFTCLTSWISLVFLMVMLGGMMVLFIYIVSLVPNEMGVITAKPLLLVALLFLISFSYMNLNYNFSMQINQFLSNWSLIFMVGLILVFILVIVVKNSLKPSMSLKSLI